jgi:hypothetical protein
MRRKQERMQELRIWNHAKHGKLSVLRQCQKINYLNNFVELIKSITFVQKNNGSSRIYKKAH